MPGNFAIADNGRARRIQRFGADAVRLDFLDFAGAQHAHIRHFIGQGLGINRVQAAFFFFGKRNHHLAAFIIRNAVFRAVLLHQLGAAAAQAGF